MKKILLLATLFAATVSNAQVVLWNGEDKEVGSDGGFWNRADPTVVEEDGNAEGKSRRMGPGAPQCSPARRRCQLQRTAPTVFPSEDVG